MATADFSRVHDDPYAGALPPLVVDRQRIIQSSAFRRLQYKTQVFIAREGGQFRTRLTHTLEVAHLARRIATALGLDEQLAEVVGLAHDLGHPPFGHAGERALQRCLQAHGAGFEHNEQTLRVVTHLEHPYPAFRGLNLTGAVRACLQTHATPFDRPGDASLRPAPLEGQVVAQADELAYTLHDLQDGLHAGLLEPAQLMQAELWQATYEGPSTPMRADCLRHLRPAVERIQARFIDDLRASFDWRCGGSGVSSSADARDRPEVLVKPSDAARRRLNALQRLLKAAVYGAAQVTRMDRQAARVVEGVFNAYLDKPQRMPARYSAHVERDGVARVVTDYVAGMTDRFCRDEHARLRGARAGA
jgi:dGTPase